MPIGSALYSDEDGSLRGWSCSVCGYEHVHAEHMSNNEESAMECCPQYECEHCGERYAYQSDANACHPGYDCDSCGEYTQDPDHVCDEDVYYDDHGNRQEVGYPEEIHLIIPQTLLYVPRIEGRPARACSVEQEICSGAAVVARMLNRIDLSMYDRIMSYGRDADPRWMLVKTDSSLPPGGGEIIYSRFNLAQTEDVRKLSKAVACIRALREEGLVKTTTAAGTHIHIGAVDESGGNVFGPAQMASLYEIFSFTEEVLFQLATAGWQYHRDQGGEFSRALTKFDKVSAGKIARSFTNHDHRYFSLNFLRLLEAARRCNCGACVSGDWSECECGVMEQGTIEWRVFNATTKPETLHAWVLLAHGLTAAAFDHQLGTLTPNAWRQTSEELHPWIFGWILRNCPFLDEERQIIVNCARRVPTLKIDWEDFIRNHGGWGQLELPDLEEEGEHLVSPHAVQNLNEAFAESIDWIPAIQNLTATVDSASSTWQQMSEAIFNTSLNVETDYPDSEEIEEDEPF